MQPRECLRYSILARIRAITKTPWHDSTTKYQGNRNSCANGSNPAWLLGSNGRGAVAAAAEFKAVRRYQDPGRDAGRRRHWLCGVRQKAGMKFARTQNGDACDD